MNIWYLYIIIMHILCILVDNNFLFHQTHTGDLTLNSNVTCDSKETVTCIRINQDDVTLDCNGYSIIGPGADVVGTGIRVFGNNVIIKNCNVENFRDGIQTQSARGLSSAVTVESTTFSKNDIGINQIEGSLTLKNVLVENNGEGHNVAGNERTKLTIENGYFCNNSVKDIIARPIDSSGECPRVEATGQIFASTFGGDSRCPPIEDVINESLEENGFGPIKSCTDLVAQQSLLSDI